VPVEPFALTTPIERGYAVDVALSGEEPDQPRKSRSSLGENRNLYRVLSLRHMGLRLGQIAARSALGTAELGRVDRRPGE